MGRTSGSQNIGPTRPRFRTEVFEDSVRVPPERYVPAGVQAVPSRTMDGLRAQGELVKITNAQGQVQWVIVYRMANGQVKTGP